MKLPDFIVKILNHKTSKKELFLSLVLESDYVAGACWYLNSHGIPKLEHAVVRRTLVDTWEEKIIASDQVISALEQKTESDSIYKVIFGLPSVYLTETGDINSDIRIQLKKLTQELTLKPIGFVPVHQAIAFKLKSDEGIPPSAIFIGVTAEGLSIFIYKVGKLISQEIIYNKRIDEWLAEIINFLTKSADIEILPSRILLFGVEKSLIENLQNKCISFPWTSKVNFLHLPKVEILGSDMVIKSVSISGASEISNQVQTFQENDQEKTEISDNKHINNKKDEDQIETSGILQEENQDIEPEIEANEISENEESNIKYKEESNDKSSYNKNDDLPIGKENNFENNERSLSDLQMSDKFENKIEIDEQSDYIQEDIEEKESNIQVVSPESLGFRSRDILESKTQLQTPKDKILEPQVDKENIRGKNISSKKKIFFIPKLNFKFGSLFNLIKSKIQGKAALLILIPIFLFLVFGLYYVIANVLPKVNIIIKTLPKQIEETNQITIDPKIDSINIDEKILPVKNIGKSVSGEATIKVTGTKQIGDPAKGTVVIYNKTLSSKIFKKGSILKGSGIEFTLDSDVDVASASESIGSITFGKNSVNITSTSIGAKGNIDANVEFVFDNFSSAQIVARNDKAFSGGTSRDITVVTRKDNDDLVEKVSKDLVNKAKQELTSSVGGGQILIEDTVETSVKENKFDSEIGQEKKELHGSVVLNISGKVMEISDLNKIFEPILSKKAGLGYKINSEAIKYEILNVTIKKDNKIVVKIKTTGQALPSLDIDNVKKDLAGKNISEATEYIKKIEGIKEVNIDFSYAILKNKIPRNIKNINIEIVN